MATATIMLTPGAALFPDSSASNAAPALQRVKSSAAAPTPYFLQLAYDATTEEMCFWQFRMPADYASALVAKIQYKMASATSGTVEFDVSIMAVTPGDAQDVDADGFAALNSASDTVPGTAGYLDEVSITVTNADSVAAGDFVVARLARDAPTDSATGDCEVVMFVLEYTTT